MKIKNSLGIASAILILLYSSAAIAESKLFYVGTGYELNSLNYNKGNTEISNNSYYSYKRDKFFVKDFHSLNLFAGFNASDINTSFELGYSSKKDASKSSQASDLVWTNGTSAVGVKTDSSLSIISMNAIYNQKINDIFTFIPTVGISRIFYKTKADLLNEGQVMLTTSEKDSGFGLNVGAGLEAKLIENVSIRALVKYTKVQSIEAFDSMLSYNAGIKLAF